MAEIWTPVRLLQAMAARGDQPAVITIAGETTQAHSYSDIASRAGRLAAGLIDHGVKPGEPVALFAPNGPDWVVARLAIAAAGAVGTAIDDIADADEAAMILADSGCQRVLTTSQHLPLVRKAASARPLEIFVMDDCSRGEEPANGDREPDRGGRPWRELFAPAPRELPAVDPQAHAALIYTSGTTGAPKSFFLSYSNISANLTAIRDIGVVGPNDRLLMPLPLHHVYPFVVGLLTPLVIGAAVVLPEAPSGPQIVHAVKHGGATVMIGVPRLYEAMLTGIQGRVAARGRLARTLFSAMLRLSLWTCQRSGLRPGGVLFGPLHREIGPQLRLMVSAGAKLSPEIAWELIALGWDVLTGYGLAETSSAFTGNVPGQLRIGSEGRPLGDGEARIGDANEHGLGEIQLRGPNVFAGYRNNAEANANAFTTDGWFRSGDQGYLDEDGYVYVTGRIKELIVLGGAKKVFPEEIESRYGNTDIIREIAVLERSGALAALVVPDLEAIRRRGNAGIEDVIRVHLTSVGRQLPSHQRLSGFALTQQPLPRTRLGKYRRHELPDLYDKARRGDRGRPAAEMSAEDRAFIERSPGREVWRILHDRYPDKAVDLDSNPQLDLGIDSLEWVNIGLELERALQVRLSEQDIAAADSVRALITTLERARDRDPNTVAGGMDAPLSPDERRWLASPGGALAGVQTGLYWVNRGLTAALFRLRTVGVENLPENRPYVIIANHVSDIDPVVMAAALPLSHMRRIHWGGDKGRLFGGPVRERFCRAAQIFPVDERAPSRALAMAVAVLEQGDSLIWFPEMWRSPTGELQRFLPGIGSVLARVPVAVVPAYIDGAFEAMPRDRRLPRPHPVMVTFGPALSVDRLIGDGSDGGEGGTEGRGQTDAARIVAALRRHVAALATPRPNRG